MSVFTDVLAAGDMEPVVFVIARFQDELVSESVRSQMLKRVQHDRKLTFGVTKESSLLTAHGSLLSELYVLSLSLCGCARPRE